MDNQYLIKATSRHLKIHEKIDFQNLCWLGNKLTIRVGISSQIPMTLCTTNVPRFLYSSFRFFFSFFYVLYTDDVIFKIYEGLYLSNSYQDNVVYSEKNMNHVCVFPPRRPHSFFLESFPF